MRKSNLPTYTSHTTRTRGGVGFYADDRNNDRMEEMGCIAPTHGEVPLPGELRRWSVREGKGQRWDLGRLAVQETCRCCGEEEMMTNIIRICAECTRNQGQTFGREAEEDFEGAKIASIAIRYKAGEISMDEALALAYEIG